MSNKPNSPNILEQVYFAKWQHPPLSQNIQICLNPGELHGNQFEVYFEKRSGEQVHVGHVCPEFEHQFPYALVELKSESNLLPPESRNKWILGVAFTTKQLQFDASRPMRIDIEPTVGPGTYNSLTVEPVQWDNWSPGFGLAATRLAKDDYQIQYKWAEREMALVPLQN